jgi:hypothetical protein
MMRVSFPWLIVFDFLLLRRVKVVEGIAGRINEFDIVFRFCEQSVYDLTDSLLIRHGYDKPPRSIFKA